MHCAPTGSDDRYVKMIFRCVVNQTVCFRWVMSSAKKEDADEEIAKYDGRYR